MRRGCAGAGEKDPDLYWKDENPTQVLEMLYSGRGCHRGFSVCPGRTDERNHLPFVLAVDAEITLIDSDNRVTGIEFTHSHQAEIGQVWLPIGVATRQLAQLWNVLGEIERHLQEFVLHQRKYV